MRGVDIVFYVVVLKQVLICEDYLFEVIQINFIGGQNVVEVVFLY